MMMAFGQFVFSLDTLAYQDLQRQTSWRHPSNSRVGARPARQYASPGEDTMNLPGLLLPGLAGDTGSLAELRAMGDAGTAWPLVDGSGIVYGQFVIESLNETRTLFFRDGTARRSEFQLQLARVDDDRTDTVGDDEAQGAEG